MCRNYGTSNRQIGKAHLFYIRLIADSKLNVIRFRVEIFSNCVIIVLVYMKYFSLFPPPLCLKVLHVKHEFSAINKVRKMIRFRNPGTQYHTQIQVLKLLYNNLKNKTFFTLDDMARVIANANLMTAYGYAGSNAIKLSHTEQESLNSAKMNAKMYAEVFRMLGWITPYDTTSSYPLVFTYIGIHVALSSGDCSKLYEQCVLGINTPNQFSGNMSYTENIRFFKCVLRTLIDLDGIMYKHELCLGPMCINDNNETEYTNMIAYIKSIRGDVSKLHNAFSMLATSLGMKTTPVDNCTRLPIGFMKSCNWIESIIDKSLYGVPLTCIKITQHGIDIYNSIKDMYDLRYEGYKSCDDSIKPSLIRLGIYGMLSRAEYDLSSLEATIQHDKITCEDFLNGKELLFSPCQTIRRLPIESALGIKLYGDSNTDNSIDSINSTTQEHKKSSSIQELEINIPNSVNLKMLSSKEDISFLSLIYELKKKGLSIIEIIDFLFSYYKNATQSTFYPLIATLFKIMGYDCHVSRPGDNGARWDAIIEDSKRSIPIEIKSPTEQEHLSIKAIRQALENKIVLLSRKTYITIPDVTSLAIGYYMPNERAEVSSLICDIKTTYGYRIGVIDFRSLLSMALSVLLNEKGFDKESLYYLEGLINASVQ